MSSKAFIFFILLLNLFLFVTSEKTIFDKTNLKHLKLKNRIFRAAVGDTSFHNITEKYQKKASNYMTSFPKMK